MKSFEKLYKQSMYIPQEKETLAIEPEEEMIADATNKTEQPQQSHTCPAQVQVQKPVACRHAGMPQNYGHS